jgi:hypothetical protein
MRRSRVAAGDGPPLAVARVDPQVHPQRWPTPRETVRSVTPHQVLWFSCEGKGNISARGPRPLSPLFAAGAHHHPQKRERAVDKATPNLGPPRSKCFPSPQQELNRLASPLASSTVLWMKARPIPRALGVCHTTRRREGAS